MATVVRTSLPVILHFIRARLVEVLRFPEERVLILARDALPGDFQATQYCWLRPRRQSPNLPVIYGAGRNDARMTRTLAVTLRTALSADESGQDAEWLTQEGLGHLQAEHALYDALLLFQPTDAHGNWLVYEPLHPREATGPERIIPCSWGESTLEFEVAYQLDLQTAYQ